VNLFKPYAALKVNVIENMPEVEDCFATKTFRGTPNFRIIQTPVLILYFSLYFVFSYSYSCFSYSVARLTTSDEICRQP